MNKKLIGGIIFICFIVIFIIFNLKWTNRSFGDNANGVCDGKSDYLKINPDVPDGLLYQSINDNITENYTRMGIEKTQYHDSNNQLINDYGGIYSKRPPLYHFKAWAYYCEDTDKMAQEIEYFFYCFGPSLGCFHERFAYICGDKYWIRDVYCDGPALYGPFEIE